MGLFMTPIESPCSEGLTLGLYPVEVTRHLILGQGLSGGSSRLSSQHVPCRVLAVEAIASRALSLGSSL